MRKTWKISGMHCAHCEKTVTHILQGREGLSDIRVDYRAGTMQAEWEPKKIQESQIREILRESGYDLVQSAWMPWVFLAVILLLLVPGRRIVDQFPVAAEGMGYGALFLLGVMTSLHCISMCGGFILAQAEDSRKILSYNAGRVLGYTAMGAICGLLGSFFSISEGVRSAIQMGAAGIMILMGFNLTGLFPFLHRFALPVGKRGRARSALGLGMLTALMPCGPLQAMQVLALSTGSPVKGALSLGCFALGTVPLMLSIGVVGTRLNRRFGRTMQWASGALVILMGFSLLSSGLGRMGLGRSIDTLPEGFARVENGVQYVTTELDYGSYPAITVQKGIPVEWNLHADEDRLTGCNREILIPKLSQRIQLSPGNNIIRFTPENTGEMAFSCWMGMITSTISVVDAF